MSFTQISGVEMLETSCKPTKSSDSLMPDEDSPPVIRKFINSAIYVEKPLSASISSGNTSISQKYSSEDLLELQNLRTKRCTCVSDRKNCPCHIFNPSTTDLDVQQPIGDVKTPVRKNNTNNKQIDTKLKVSKVSTVAVENNKPVRTIKNRTATKEVVEEKKRVQTGVKEKVIKKQGISDKEREEMLERERENFKNWLMNKKKAENELKKKKEKEKEQEQQLKELEKEKRQLENQLNFQLWVKKKEEAHLERRIKEQMQLIAELERKERQLKDNERAFNEWLISAKNRPKPTPLNKGLKSLCSTTSITYINPNPWHPIT